MQLLFSQAGSVQELQQILAIQQNNLRHKLSAEEIEKEGFVTVKHDLELLESMNAVCGHIIAKDADVVVGYALCMHPLFCDDIPVLKPMFTELYPVLSPGYRYMVMGQICVAKGYRGKGIFKGLYHHMSEMLKYDYDGIITEVDAKNLRSMNAHRAAGFEAIGTYSSGGQDWQLLRLSI